MTAAFLIGLCAGDVIGVAVMAWLESRPRKAECFACWITRWRMRP